MLKLLLILMLGSVPAWAALGQYEGYYCPAATLTLSGIHLTGYGGVGSGTVSGINIANADQLFLANPTFAVFNDIGADTEPALPTTTSTSGFHSSWAARCL